jgi:hypothetical protein
MIVTEVMLVLMVFLSPGLKITAIYEVMPFMFRRSERTFQWDLLSPLLRIYSTTLIGMTAGPSETQMKYSRTSCCHNREHTHTHTHTHIHIYVSMFSNFPIISHAYSNLSSSLIPGLYIHTSYYSFDLFVLLSSSYFLSVSLSFSASLVFYFMVVHCRLAYFPIF